MESFITVHYETAGFTFQNRGSDSLLGFEELHPHLKKLYITSKISKSWLGEKKCKNANDFKILKQEGCTFNQMSFALKHLGIF